MTCHSGQLTPVFIGLNEPLLLAGFIHRTGGGPYGGDHLMGIINHTVSLIAHAGGLEHRGASGWHPDRSYCETCGWFWNSYPLLGGCRYYPVMGGDLPLRPAHRAF
jgi:hypothetical protein